MYHYPRLHRSGLSETFHVKLAIMTEIQVKEAVTSAIGTLKKESPELDFGNIHERSTAHRLAVHLEPHFNTWNVDCEYDRNEQLQKKLNGIEDCRSRRETNRILPDIIIHHRQARGREHNLLVIELKKNAQEDACDRKKLELLTEPSGQYQYQLGLYVHIDGGHFHRTWYKDGKQLPS